MSKRTGKAKTTKISPRLIVRNEQEGGRVSMEMLPLEYPSVFQILDKEGNEVFAINFPEPHAMPIVTAKGTTCYVLNEVPA